MTGDELNAIRILKSRVDMQSDTLSIVVDHVRGLAEENRVLRDVVAKPHVEPLADLTKRVDALERLCHKTAISDNKWQNFIESRLEEISKVIAKK